VSKFKHKNASAQLQGWWRGRQNGSPKQNNTSQDVLHTSGPEYSLRKSPISDELRRMMCVVVMGCIEVDIDIGFSVDPWGRLVLGWDKTPSVGICQNSASMVTLLKKHLIQTHHVKADISSTHAALHNSFSFLPRPPSWLVLADVRSNVTVMISHRFVIDGGLSHAESHYLLKLI